MSIDLDDEILQDFLVEAGEILDLLGEQLIELEKTPDNIELLNAIFRGFHTVKGGAGFLAIDALVDVCHQAEDVFNVLRQGDRKVTTDLMDVVLQVLDEVHDMFAQVRVGQQPDAADLRLLDSLQSFAGTDKDESGSESQVADDKTDSIDSYSETESDQSVLTENAAEAVEREFEAMLGIAENATDKASGTQDEDDYITEEEFEALLDVLHGKENSIESKQKQAIPAKQKKAPESDEITEQEFDDLLDELHGKGQFKTTSVNKEKLTEADNIDQTTTASDEITETEFEDLLDELHGKGEFNTQQLKQTNDAFRKPVDSANLTAAKKPCENNNTDAQSVAKQTVQTNSESAQPEKILEIKSAGSKSGTARTKNLELKENQSKSTSAKKSPVTTLPVKGETTVRVDTQVLDEIMNMVGELVLVRNRFQTLRMSGNDEQISTAVSNLDVVTANLQLAVMKTRMQPIKKVFGRFPRVVRDLARNLNKEIKLELIGEETDLDKNLVEALADPLVHLVRNAVDHGIESPEDRRAVGKSKEGLIILSASQEGDHIRLTIEDNGKGMNPDLLRSKAVEKGLMDEETAARMDDKDCFNLIFAPGFSTKSEITDVSGRGVGMDVVKTRITQMNGTVEIDSREGQGSTVIIKVPLTLAIMPTLMVKLGEQAFALPLASVLEILDLDLTVSNVVDGQKVVMVREHALPLFYLSDWLVNDQSYSAKRNITSHVVVVSSGGKQIGFVVDQLIGQEEVVIKALGAKLQGLDGLSGATITGDGKIALILDVPGLMKRYAA